MFCGKKSLLLIAVVVVIAVSAAQAVTLPVIWFEDDFESYAVGSRLRQALPWASGSGPENKIQNFGGAVGPC